jgi:hypothetical protein
MMRRRRVLITFGIFSKAKFQGLFAHLNQFEFVSLGESTSSLGRLSSTTSTINKREIWD